MHDGRRDRYALCSSLEGQPMLAAILLTVLGGGPRPMNYIDAHAHVWTDDFKRYPLAKGWKPEDMAPRKFTAEELLKQMKKSGVNRAVLIQMSYYYPKSLSSKIAYGFDNSYMVDMIAKYPGVFVGTAVINPLGNDPAREMEELAKKGVRAFRIHPKLSEQPIEKWLRPDGYQKLVGSGGSKSPCMGR